MTPVSRPVVVDAQIHEPEPPRPLPDGAGEDVQALVGVEIAREAMDSVGVDAALVVADQKYMDACVARYPDRFAGALTFDADWPDLEQLVAGYRNRPGMLAGRILVATATTAELKPEFERGDFDPLCRYADRYRLPLFFSTHGWAHVLEPIARRHPGLTMIVDHLGVSQSPLSPPRPDPWDRLPGLLKLAQFPNVHVKLCGAPVLSARPYPYEDVWPNLHRVIEAFSPSRVMWASDFTRMRWVPITGELAPRDRWWLYSDCLNYLMHTDELGPADKAEILGGTVRRVLGWPAPH